MTDKDQVVEETIERYGADTLMVDATGKQAATVQLQADEVIGEAAAIASAAVAGDEDVPMEFALHVALNGLRTLYEWLTGAVIATYTIANLADVGQLSVPDFMAKVAAMPDYDLSAEAEKYGLVASAAAEPQDDERSESSD